MKTQLIYLDAHDDHASARDKLNWARADRVVLVWPAHGRILTRRLDLLLLVRAAHAQGGKLGLVTHDPDVRAHAEDLGLPVFDTPDRLPESGWSVGREPRHPEPARPVRSRQPRLEPRRRRTRPAPRSRAERFALALLPPIALLALAATIVPAAVIELRPLTTTQAIEFEVTLDEAGTGGAETIPARQILTSTQGDLRQPTSGRVLIPSSAASGSIIFTNLASEALDVPPGTGVQTDDGIRFETLEATHLDPGPGTQASAEVRAAELGNAGNVPSGAIAAVEGPLGLQVSVTNPQPTSGGASSERSGVAAADVLALREALTRQLLQEVRRSVEAELLPGEALAPDSVRVSRVEESRYSPAVGEPADSLELHLALEIRATAFAHDDLLERTSRILDGESAGAFSTVPDSTRAELAAPRADGGGRTYFGTAQREIYRSVDADWLRRLLAGRPRDEAGTLLDGQLDLAEPPRLHLWPSWLPWLPLLPVRMDIHFTWGSS